MMLSSKQVSRFQTLFNDTPPDIDKLMDECYHDRVLFRDPLTERRGTEALASYLRSAYTNVTRCEFDFGESAKNAHSVLLPWSMTLEHPRLAGGKAFFVEGVSLLQGQDDLIIFHRDYYDAGKLLYENIPLIGRIIQWIRSRAA
ncbi:nuclear transport factor 2 family protein [Salicola sp. Rm-C-2C1-2]|uniref:nuclear transport factor 2 family protein n=1 Tax=Salicola sp. Rm-C-2C1-2 TaxID=3141321 RepID=UPI0032E45F85